VYVVILSDENCIWGKNGFFNVAARAVDVSDLLCCRATVNDTMSLGIRLHAFRKSHERDGQLCARDMISAPTAAAATIQARPFRSEFPRTALSARPGRGRDIARPFFVRSVLDRFRRVRRLGGRLRFRRNPNAIRTYGLHQMKSITVFLLP